MIKTRSRFESTILEHEEADEELDNVSHNIGDIDYLFPRVRKSEEQLGQLLPSPATKTSSVGGEPRKVESDSDDAPPYEMQESPVDDGLPQPADMLSTSAPHRDPLKQMIRGSLRPGTGQRLHR